MVRLAHAMADAAARETLAGFRRDIPTDNKATDGAYDPVTYADRAAETAMRLVLAEAAPDHGVRGEECADTPANGPWTWILDPIDGTGAYVAGLPLWTTLIGCAYEETPVVGLIAQPYLGERFVGRPEGAVFQRGALHQPLTARHCDDLGQAVIATTDPALFSGAEAGAFHLVRGAARLARLGCDAYAYAMVAAGRIDLVIESGLKRHDVAALIPLITGAGGQVTDWRGRSGVLEGQILASGAGSAREEAIIALKRASTL